MCASPTLLPSRSARATYSAGGGTDATTEHPPQRHTLHLAARPTRTRAQQRSKPSTAKGGGLEQSQTAAEAFRAGEPVPLRSPAAEAPLRSADNAARAWLWAQEQQQERGRLWDVWSRGDDGRPARPPAVCQGAADAHHERRRGAGQLDGVMSTQSYYLGDWYFGHAGSAGGFTVGHH